MRKREFEKLLKQAIIEEAEEQGAIFEASPETEPIPETAQARFDAALNGKRRPNRSVFTRLRYFAYRNGRRLAFGAIAAGIVAALVLVVGLLTRTVLNGEKGGSAPENSDHASTSAPVHTSEPAIISKPEIAFEQCFGFSLPDKAQIVTSKTRRPVNQGKSIYAFELVFHEEQYEQLRKDLDSYANRLHEKTEYRSSDNPWKKEEGDFFNDAFDLGRWSRDIWKEQNPSVILFYASTYNDVGYDYDKRLHRTYIMVAKEQDGLFRMYAFTT